MHRRTFLQTAAAAGSASLLKPLSALAIAASPEYADHVDLSYVLQADGTRRPIKSVADWNERRKHVLAAMQSVMGRLPENRDGVPLDMQVVSEEKRDRFVLQKISYQTDSTDRRVRAWLFRPPTSNKRPAVLCLHQTTRIGKDEPAGLGGKPNLHYARELAERGYVTLAPDYPSFGEYPYEFPAADGYISGTMKAIVDNMRAVDLLQSLEVVANDRIGCVGHSLGGHNTMFTAAFDQRIRAMVSSCGFTRFHKYYSGRLKGWTSKRYMPLIDSRHHNDPDQVPFDFPEIISSFAPRAFFTSSPIGDGNFEVSGVRDSIAAAASIYKLHDAAHNLQAIYPECGHDFPLDARETAWQFFDRHLEHDPAA